MVGVLDGHGLIISRNDYGLIYLNNSLLPISMASPFEQLPVGKIVSSFPNKSYPPFVK